MAYAIRTREIARATGSPLLGVSTIAVGIPHTVRRGGLGSHVACVSLGAVAGGAAVTGRRFCRRAVAMPPNLRPPAGNVKMMRHLTA